MPCEAQTTPAAFVLLRQRSGAWRRTIASGKPGQAGSGCEVRSMGILWVAKFHDDGGWWAMGAKGDQAKGKVDEPYPRREAPTHETRA